MAGYYPWIDFYMELADKLHMYRQDRSILIRKLQIVYEDTGMRMPKLENQGVPSDIDPFTVFGLANKGIADANRIRILKGLKSELGISAEVPKVFDGIPVLNNMKATFYWFEGDRGEGDIDNLWTVFDNALQLSEADILRNMVRRRYGCSTR